MGGIPSGQFSDESRASDGDRARTSIDGKLGGRFPRVSGLPRDALDSDGLGRWVECGGVDGSVE